MTDIVQGAPEALVKQNVFYLHLKMTLAQHDQELTTLKEVSIGQKRELDILKVKYDTLEQSHQ